MSMTRASTTVDAWRQWFATEKQALCRAHLCTRYRLNALDAEALINTALLQVVRHWPTLDNPLAYFWQTLKHAGTKQGRRRDYERQELRAYAQQCRLQAHGAALTAPEAVRGADRALRAQLHSSSHRYHFRACCFSNLRQNFHAPREDHDPGKLDVQDSLIVSPRVVYSQSLGLDETLQAKEIVR
jgi:hypothetical protein